MSIIVEGALFLVLAGVAAIVVALAVKLFKGLGSRDRDTEDSRIIQETHQGLSRLEERIEALETILLDRKDRESGK